jgi:hypothetical protein
LEGAVGWPKADGIVVVGDWPNADAVEVDDWPKADGIGLDEGEDPKAEGVEEDPNADAWLNAEGCAKADVEGLEDGQNAEGVVEEGV